MNTALILEDIVDMQVWHANALAEVYPSIQCFTASSIAAAKALIQQHRFDIALIDLGLPDGSGVEVIAQLALTQPDSLSIVITIFDDNEHLFPALKAGAQGYLLKDLSQQQFVARLKNIAEGEPPLSPSISRRLLDHFAHYRENKAQDAEHNLTAREQEVLQLISKGLTLLKVAEMLAISRNTTAGHVKAIYRKLNISSRAEAVAEANRLGLIRY